MTTPALRALKEGRPSRELTMLCSSLGAAAVPFIPEIDDHIVYNAPWVKHNLPVNSAIDLGMIQNLSHHHFDAAVIFTVFSQNPLPAALMCYLAGIPLRLAHCHENPYYLLTDWIKDEEPTHGIRHEVERQLDLVSSVGFATSNTKLSWCVPLMVKEEMIARLQDAGIDLARKMVIIHPGATAPSRRYPLEKFKLVATNLVQELDCQVIITGQHEEKELIESIKKDGGADIHAFVDLNLAEFSAVLSLANLLISNNTGPVHIAAALGTPVVDLYALTNPQHTPWQVSHRVLFHDVPCKYCFKSICPQGHHECLELIPWQDVVDAAEELLKGDSHVHIRH